MNRRTQRHENASALMDPRWFMELAPDRVRPFEANEYRRSHSLILRFRAALVRLLVG